jgi:hypothetical protein
MVTTAVVMRDLFDDALKILRATWENGADRKYI